MPVTDFYNLLRTFDSSSKFDGNNWSDYKREFNATFRADPDLYEHFGPSSTCPPFNEPTLVQAWKAVEANAWTAIYKTVASKQIQRSYCKEKDTAAKIWAALVADLAAIGHEVEDLEIIDSIIMHLDPTWGIMHSILLVRETDPNLQELTGLLKEFEKDPNRFKSPGVEEVMHSKSKKKGSKGGKRSSRKDSEEKRSSRRDSEESGTESDSGSDSFDWLNTKGRDDVCHRCGRPGHRSSRCMANMPQHVKDKIMERASRARANRTIASDSDDDGPVDAHFLHHFLHAARPANRAQSAHTSSTHQHRDAAASGSERTSSSVSSSDSDSDFAAYMAPRTKGKSRAPTSKADVAKEARKMLARLQV
ncbi:hypothetical protein B0H11DRAFT_863611 [Mycena galericulata]|nr:hypothetical protein B0H11DRAFT_863611 [Mycena galericulata]